MESSKGLNIPEQRILLRLAREAIRTSLYSKYQMIPAVTFDPQLQKKCGVFVTLRLESELRGCIGFSFATYPLAEAVQEAAVSAAFHDLRFSPLQLNEFEKIEVEISVLTQPYLIQPQEIQVGIHGLIIRENAKMGLLLPQVAIEHQWSKETFLEQTCLKAGLAKDAWKRKAEVLAFEAQILSENHLSGF
jgi:AmmeMemoRadiSam system protein A